jgi:hypothetical protein
VPEDGQELQIPSIQNLSNQEFWVHHTPNILQNGRVSHMDPENVPDDVDPEVLKKQIEAKDPYEKRLKPISADRDVNVGGTGKYSK